MRDFCVTIDGKDGMFTIEKRLTIFREHSSEKSVKETMQAIKKELGKMVKAGQVMLTTLKMDDNYNQYSHKRYIFTQWCVDDLYELDYREFNGYDFSDKKLISFDSMNALTTFIIKNMYADVKTTLGEIPENDSLYAQSIR